MPDQNSQPFETVLKQQLRNNTAYIADDGFSQNVMARLPRRSIVSLGLLGWVVASLGVVLGLLFALPLLAVPIFYWAAGLTLVSLVKIGLAMAVFILAISVFWMARELDCI